MIVFLLILLLPALLVAVYARPQADDIVYGMDVYHALQNGAGLGGVLSAAWKSNMYFFDNWQGLYSSGFVLALQPGVFGMRYYGLSTVFLVVLLWLCLWAAMHFVVKRVLPGNRLLSLTLAVFFTFVMVEGMPNQVEGLYWFNGAGNYVTFYALAILNTGLILELFFAKQESMPHNVWILMLSCVVGFIVSGGHHVAALVNCMMLDLATLAFLWKKNFWSLLPLASALGGMVVNLTAPGTAVRAGTFAGAGFVEAVVKSGILAALELLRWLDVPYLCVLALLVPLALGIAARKDIPDRAFSWPWLAPAVTFILMWGMIFLPSYTMGGIGAGRLINLVWMTYLLGMSVSWCVLVCWFVRRYDWDVPELLKKAKPYKKKLKLAAVAMILCIACIGGRTVKEGLDNCFATSLEALWELGQGHPQRFAAAMDARDVYLRSTTELDVTIPPLTEEERRSLLLLFNEPGEGPDVWGLSGYYGLHSVTFCAAD